MITHDEAPGFAFDAHAPESLVRAGEPDLEMAGSLVGGYVPPEGAALVVGRGSGRLDFLPANPTVHPGPAEALPFPDASFDLAVTRYSAHHWTRLDKTLREMRRVLRPGGYLLAIDVEGDGNALLDTHLQMLEVLRDPSHVRDRTAREWRALLAEAGFKLSQEEHWPLRLEFGPWTAQAATPPERAGLIRALQEEAPEEVRKGLALEPDGSFTVWTALFWARRP